MKHKEFSKSLSNIIKSNKKNKVTLIKQHDNEGYDKGIKMIKKHDEMIKEKDCYLKIK